MNDIRFEVFVNFLSIKVYNFREMYGKCLLFKDSIVLKIVAYYLIR